MSEKKTDWLQEAGTYVEERERHLLDAIEEVERAKYTVPDPPTLDQGTEAVLCFLAGSLKEARRTEGILHRFLEQRAEEKKKADEKKMRVGDRVKVVANTYRDGSASDYRGRVGTVQEVDGDGGCQIELAGLYGSRTYFEAQELEKI